MNFLNEIKEETILICRNIEKKKLTKEMSAFPSMIPLHIYSIEEIKKNFFFDYNKKTIYYTKEYLNTSVSIAKEMIENLYFIKEEKYENKKLDDLVKLKKYLDENNLLIYDSYFKNFLKNKQVLVYNESYFDAYESFFVKEISSYVPITVINEQKQEINTKTIYHLTSLEEEVEFVANKICDLLTEGVDKTKIKIINTSEDYVPSLKRIFSFYHLPICLSSKECLYGTSLVQDFLRLYSSDLENTFLELEKKYSKEEINQIVSICNDYAFTDDYLKVKEFIIEDLKKTVVKAKRIKDAIEICSLEEVEKDDYVFFMNFNLNCDVVYKKDEEYLSDALRERLGISYTYVENKRKKQRVKDFINNRRHLVLTYKDKSMINHFFPSNLIKEMSMEVKEGKYFYKYSKEALKVTLARMLDRYIKFGDKDQDLEKLYNGLSLDYNTYDNGFTSVDQNTFFDFINRDLKLSYTTFDTYNRCAFRYYLTNVLKLDIYEDNFIAFVGSLFHFVLEKGVKEEINIEKEVEQYLQKKERNLTAKEQFLLNKMVKQLDGIVQTIKMQMSHSKLDQLLCEEKIEVVFDKEIPVVFKGFIDKICYKKINDRTIVAIVDYKSGSASIDLKNSKYAIGMQLPIYLYLASSCKKLENVEFAGFYLQTILHKEFDVENKKSYEEQEEEYLKLNGYSTNEVETLELFDDSYFASKVIKGMKMTSKGDFGTKRVLTKEEIDHLITLTKKHINNTIDHILKAEFPINPKQIGSSDKDKVGCEYCKFKDICFVKNKDFVKLQKQEDLSFLDE